MAEVQLTLVWSQEVHQMAITSYILHVHRPYFKPEHHKWEFSPQKSKSTQQYLWLSFSPTPFSTRYSFYSFQATVLLVYLGLLAHLHRDFQSSSML